MSDNMLKFRSPDGSVFEGHDYTEIVANMAGEKLTPPKSLATYRRATATRLHSLKPEAAINTNSNTAFVQSLVQSGLLEKVT